MPYNKKRQIDAGSDGELQTAKKVKSESRKASKDLSKGTDAEGNAYWEIGNKRRIGSSQFKGTTLVNIREYYTAPDGDLKPGKKGISLSLDQYRAFLKVIPELNEHLRSQGHAVDDPPSAGSGDVLGKADEPAKPKKPKKSNIEETSEEEDNEEIFG
ncbi:putative RNA polymerase II transcriptional coactivator [Madurella mycetomatis]|uniref:RNA polymerase II transcriptional coactivator n=1 Tax=Madurella mycetomatis TaxID=100816 RepID=A0A175VY51_9PEZI|nr:putative RNA polymerase II transcriptional coactivator [Madurella mycetomatis]